MDEWEERAYKRGEHMEERAEIQISEYEGKYKKRIYGK